MGSNAIITENAINKPYTRPPALPDGNDPITEVRLEGALMA
jgi:hypothetical protein